MTIVPKTSPAFSRITRDSYTTFFAAFEKSAETYSTAWPPGGIHRITRCMTARGLVVSLLYHCCFGNRNNPRQSNKATKPYLKTRGACPHADMTANSVLDTNFYRSILEPPQCGHACSPATGLESRLNYGGRMAFALCASWLHTCPAAQKGMLLRPHDALRPASRCSGEISTTPRFDHPVGFSIFLLNGGSRRLEMLIRNKAMRWLTCCIREPNILPGRIAILRNSSQPRGARRASILVLAG